MKRLHTHIAVLLCIVSGHQTIAQPSSTFDTGTESWGTVCDGSCSAPTPTWASTAGNPGGCVTGTDVSTGTWYFRSPAEFNIDLSGYYGCNLKFHLKQNSTLFSFNAEDVIIVRGSDGKRIAYNTSPNPGTTWTAYTVPITEDGWTYDDLSGSPVTADDMILWLSDVNRIWIRAEYSGLTYETDWIDNVEIDCSLILPVELYSFEGMETEPNVAKISWTTLSETNCSGYQLEKSVTEGMVYDSIGYLPGNGTTNQPHDYVLIDDNFTSPALYRIKQTDFDGEITYSNIISLSPQNEGTISTTVYPNPASEYVYMESNAKSKYYFAVEISDLSGRTILHTTDITHTYPARAVIDVKHIKSGMYFITFLSEQGNETLPLQIVQQ
jgi:hypothetical protein